MRAGERNSGVSCSSRMCVRRMLTVSVECSFGFQREQILSGSFVVRVKVLRVQPTSRVAANQI